MRFFIKELLFFCIEKFFLKISRLLVLMFSAQTKLFFSKVAPVSNIGKIDIGQNLLDKANLFGNVLLDVKTDNPWRILPFSEEVEVGIDGFQWLNDLALINNQRSRDLSEAWLYLFPFNRLNINTHSSSARLVAILRNFSYLRIGNNKKILNKVNKIIRNDYFFLNCYKYFSFNVLERLTICHSLILSAYVFNFTKKKAEEND